MDYVVGTTALSEQTVDIPVPSEAWHREIDESVEFEVEHVSLDSGHFGVNYRRC